MAEDVIGVIFAGLAVNYRNDGSSREQNEAGRPRRSGGEIGNVCEIFESHTVSALARPLVDARGCSG